MAKEKVNQPKRSISEVAGQIPSSLKFGIIMAIALFWAQLLRSVLDVLFSLLTISAPILADFIIALVATVLGYLVLLSYRRIQSTMKKIKV